MQQALFLSTRHPQFKEKMWELKRCILSFVSARIHSFGHKWEVWGCYVENKQERRKEYKANMWVQHEKLTQESEGFCFDFLSISLLCLTEKSPLNSHFYCIVSVHISIHRVLEICGWKGISIFFLRTVNLKLNNATYWGWTKAHVSLAGTELLCPVLCRIKPLIWGFKTLNSLSVPFSL